MSRSTAPAHVSSTHGSWHRQQPRAADPPPRRKLRRGLTCSIALIVVAATSLASASAALAHAQLLGTSPLSGSTVKTQPKEVIFKFGEPVGGDLGAVRVYDAQGREVDNLKVAHPQG
ncbi:MAG TPA: copper resistance protein CopC, partial [Solirubrobacteraceae bacterium]|nr:copper resistance protein CopC [Solirubrobacteraceae bacterium]